ncbi:hypothetical protein [Parapedobacter sp.]
MKKLFISAIAVVAMLTTFAQEKTTKVKVASKNETRAEAGAGSVKTKQKMKGKAEAENAMLVRSAADVALEAVDEVSADVIDNQPLNAAAEHGIAVSTVATSPELIGAKGAMVSEIATIKALEASPNAANIKLKPTIKTNMRMKVKPVNVSTMVRVKGGLGVKL